MMSGQFRRHKHSVPACGAECVYCGDPATTYDHVQPRSRGGKSGWANIVPACYQCNEDKGPRTPDEWLAEEAA